MAEKLKVVDGGADRREVNATPWMVGVFCENCGQPWSEKAPCPHCGEFSVPQARIFRRVVRGSTFLPWTWETEYEFSDAMPDERDERVSATPAATTR